MAEAGDAKAWANGLGRYAVRLIGCKAVSGLGSGSAACSVVFAVYGYG